jgi:LacI family transcriptional regulator
LLLAIQELGIRCPDDVSILGFDELVPGTEGFSFGSLLKPELSVIAQPGYQMGNQAANMLLKMLAESENGDVVPSQRIVALKGELRIRKSLAAPAAIAR